MGRHLKLEGMFLDDDDFKHIHAAAVHKVMNESISIQVLAEVLDDLNQYGRANKLGWGTGAVELFDPETIKKAMSDDMEEHF